MSEKHIFPLFPAFQRPSESFFTISSLPPSLLRSWRWSCTGVGFSFRHQVQLCHCFLPNAWLWERIRSRDGGGQTSRSHRSKHYKNDEGMLRSQRYRFERSKTNIEILRSFDFPSQSYSALRKWRYVSLPKRLRFSRSHREPNLNLFSLCFVSINLASTHHVKSSPIFSLPNATTSNSSESRIKPIILTRPVERTKKESRSEKKLTIKFSRSSRKEINHHHKAEYFFSNQLCLRP